MIPSDHGCRALWGLPKIRGTLLGGPHNKDYSIWGLYWGPPILGNYLMEFSKDFLGCYRVVLVIGISWANMMELFWVWGFGRGKCCHPCGTVSAIQKSEKREKN